MCKFGTNLLFLLVSAVSESTVDCISPPEILLYHLSLCYSSHFDPVVKCVTWDIMCSSPESLFFFEAHLWHVTWAGILVSTSWNYCSTSELTLTVSLEEEILTWVSSVTSWRSFFITLWKHSHVRTVDECDQDGCGPFHACRKEGSWERLSIVQGGMNGVIVGWDHLEAIAGRRDNQEQCSQIQCALACVGTRSRDGKYIAV